MPETKHFILQLGNEVINTNGTEEESHSVKSCFPANSSHQSQQICSLLNNQNRTKKRKTYTKASKEEFWNGMKETRKQEVSDEERNIGIHVSYVDKVMGCNQKESDEFGKPKAIFQGICKDLLLYEQVNSSGMF